MPTEKTASLLDRLDEASQDVCRRSGNQPPNQGRLEDALSSAIDPQKMIDNYAEAWRVSPDEARAALDGHGFGSVLARLRVETSVVGQEEVQGEPLSSERVLKIAEGRIGARALSPEFDEPMTASPAILESVSKGIGAFLSGADDDALGVLYRKEPAAYAARFLAEDAPRIDAYIGEQFGEAGPRYLVNSGIGANEQFNYFVSALANARPDCRVTWLLANSPKELACMPADATIENTLFMEFSRSGITEETVKLHELSPRGAKRVVFANTGSLQALGQRDGNLVLELPSEVSGRYGRNKTPILMAPMHVAGLDVTSYWATIEAACAAMNLGDRTSLPVVLAQYIRVQQLRRGINHI